jgi:hypothetical protein
MRSTQLATTSRSLRRLPAGVTDQPGGAADNCDRLVPRLLQPPHRQQLDQVADMQPGGGRVETAIERDDSGVECLAQIVQAC